MTLYESSHVLMDLLQLLRHRYYRVVRINLTNDSYEEIVYPHLGEGKRGKVSDSFSEYAIRGLVHEDDRLAYKQFTNIEFLRNIFFKDSSAREIKFRRKFEDGRFRWMSMEIIPSTEYTDNHQVLMVYIRDIDNSYSAQVDEINLLKHKTVCDALTSLYNRRGYTEKVRFLNESHDDPVGILYTDLNNLKMINDTEGHEAGDELILSYARILKSIFRQEDCYRYGGDEFIIILPGIREDLLHSKIAALKEKLLDANISVAIGYQYSEHYSNIYDEVKIAESLMYENKKSMKRTGS